MINESGNKSSDNTSSKIIINKSETERFNPPQITRREIPRYYHTIVPRKYSYGDEGVQISNTIDNHRYREIYGNSDNSNKKIVLKIIPKQIKLKSGKVRDNNINSNDYFSYRYEAIDNSPEFYSIKTSEKKLSNAPSEKLLFNSNGEIKYSNNNKNLSNKNIPSEDEDKDKDEYKLYSANRLVNSYNNYNTLNNENNNILFRNKQYNIPKYNSNSNLKSNYNNNNNYFESNTNRNLNNENYNNDIYSIYSIPKSYSLVNLNRNKLSSPPITQNEFNYTNKSNQIIKPNNIDYEILRQTVKLALLKKLMKEQEKSWSLNNDKFLKTKKNLENLMKNKYKQKPRIGKDYDTLLNNKKFRKENDFNYKNNYNRNMLQAKLKMWKP